MDRPAPSERDLRGRISRRRLLAWGLGATATVAGAAAAGVGLVSHGVLPGRQVLLDFEGACTVAVPAEVFSPLGPGLSGRFFSRARRRTVGYTIAYPPGHDPGSVLPLIVVLHGYGANHTDALAGLSLPQALALHVNGRPLPPPWPWWRRTVAADTGTRTGATIPWAW